MKDCGIKYKSSGEGVQGYVHGLARDMDANFSGDIAD